MLRLGSGGTCSHDGGMGRIATLTRPSAFAPGAATDKSGTLSRWLGAGWNEGKGVAQPARGPVP